jgi:hypothetical protein
MLIVLLIVVGVVVLVATVADEEEEETMAGTRRINVLQAIDVNIIYCVIVSNMVTKVKYRDLAQSRRNDDNRRVEYKTIKKVAVVEYA